MGLGDALYIANHEQIAPPETYDALRLVESHKEYLTRKRAHRLFSKYQSLFGLAGFVGALGLNLALKRPPTAGLPLMALMTGAGMGTGWFIEKSVLRYRLQEWAVVEDYVKLHPEYFPSYPIPKYEDVLKPWSPYRNG